MRSVINKIIAINKLKGPTSNDVLTEIKRKLGMRKGVGHAGTLDPLASGVLVVGIGKATKKLGEVVKKEKEYITTIKLGMESETDDEEGKKEIIDVKTPPSLDEIVKVVKIFIGEIEQTPPIYSAIKVKGKEAYKLARSGQDVKLRSRKALIKNIEVIKYQWPFLELKVVTGPGVYIRSLARDIGTKLKTGGYVYELERTRVGNFKIEDSVEVKDLEI